MKKLFDMHDRIKESGLSVILIQTHEAHSSAWPMGLKEQPEPHRSFKDRIDRANEFAKDYNCPYPVYIDGWDDIFEQTFRAWPDKYHCVDSELKLIAKAEYGTQEHNEAVVTEDYTDLLERLMN